MPNPSHLLTRRQFSQALAASSAAALLVPALPAQNSEASTFAFASTWSGDDPQSGRVKLFRAGQERWTLLHEVSAPAAVHMVKHPTLPLLYVVHALATWHSLPRGAVSAYRWDMRKQTLTHAGTQPLSLSATEPSHAALTPAGDLLVVTAQSGGIYNGLPLAPDGALQPVSAIRKEYGSGEDGNGKAARPVQAVLHPDGRLFGVDPGQETVSSFGLRHAHFSAHHRRRVHAGSGPSQMELSPAGDRAYVLHAGDGSISVHAVDRQGLSEAVQRYTAAHRIETLRIHPSGQYLMAASRQHTEVLRIESSSGKVAAHAGHRSGGLRSMQFLGDGSTLLAHLADAPRVVSLPFDRNTGVLGMATSLATIAHCTSLLSLV